MKLAQAVIGANYGDEGKGVITDYLVNQTKPEIVVRANGGAQSGHTVITPDGRYHTFRHFSSGTFHGARTFLGKRFILNPMLYWKEVKALGMLHIIPHSLIVDPRAIVTTPWDIIANQARERVNPLGSCGVGIRDTMMRSETDFRFTIGGALCGKSVAQIKSILGAIRDEWLPTHLEQQGVEFTDELKALASDSGVFDRYVDELLDMRYVISLIDTGYLDISGGILFEGSQGLGLDQTYGTVPNVTRSNTGLTNIIEFCEEAKIDAVETYYVTRAYLTRHGKGHMENESGKPFSRVTETSNVTNEFQGEFRFGTLDVKAMRNRIRNDLQRQSKSKVKIFPKLAVTCLDQVDDLGRYNDGATVTVRRESMGASIARAVGLSHVLESHGPTRNTIIERVAI